MTLQNQLISIAERIEGRMGLKPEQIEILKNTTEDEIEELSPDANLLLRLKLRHGPAGEEFGPFQNDHCYNGMGVLVKFKSGLIVKKSDPFYTVFEP